MRDVCRKFFSEISDELATDVGSGEVEPGELRVANRLEERRRGVGSGEFSEQLTNSVESLQGFGAAKESLERLPDCWGGCKPLGQLANHLGRLKINSDGCESFGTAFELFRAQADRAASLKSFWGFCRIFGAAESSKGCLPENWDGCKLF
jgi:hypothetical protein